MNPQGTARRWPGPPLALQIMALLLGGLAVAQGVTLALTMLLPPEPQRQWELGDIARVLSGRAAEGRNANLLLRSLQARAPEPKGQGWLTSERSRLDLAHLLERNETEVRLYFFTPLPFAGTTGPVADAGDAPRARPQPHPIATAFAASASASGGGGNFLRVQAGGPGGPGGAAGPAFPGGMGGSNGGFGIGRGSVGSGGGFSQPSQPGGVTGSAARGTAPVDPSAPAAAIGCAPGSPGTLAAPATPATPAAPGLSMGAPPGLPAHAGPPSLAAPPFPPGMPPGPGAPAMQPLPEMPSLQALPPVVERPPPRKAPATNETPAARAPATPTQRTDPAARAPAASSPAASAPVPGPRTDAQAPRPPRSTDTPRTPPSTDTTAEVERPTARGLFGLAPAPFVEGDFIAAVHTREGSWVVVQPVPESFPNAWQRRVLLWFLLAAAIVVPAGWLFSRRLVRPITGFARAADQLGRDPSAPVLALEGPAEIGRAAQAFNRMQARLRSFVDDRTVMIGAISHDLRTPLTRLRFRIEDVPDDVRAGMLEDVEEMERMIGSVLGFIRDASVVSARERMDLSSLVEDVVEQAVFVGKDVRLQRTEAAPVEVDAMGMRRVLDNLIENAVKYGHQARVRLFTDGADAVAEVSDRGPGLPADELERVFKPFYRSPQALASRAAGSGLGLAVCRSIVRAHGGDVVLKSGPHGLLAQVRVPLALDAEAKRPSLQAAVAP